MKCAVCKQEIPLVFLDKLRGTYIRDQKGKKHPVCFSCQKRLGSKEAMQTELEK